MEIQNKIQTPSSKKAYDLEERTFQFAKLVCLTCKKIPKTISSVEYIKQVIRSSSSIGANYIEANEALTKKEFVHRANISRKETKETIYWLRLIAETSEEGENEILQQLLDEGIQLKKILSAIIEKSK